MRPGCWLGHVNSVAVRAAGREGALMLEYVYSIRTHYMAQKQLATLRLRNEGRLSNPATEP